jgi:chromosome partitioning protein
MTCAACVACAVCASCATLHVCARNSSAPAVPFVVACLCQKGGVGKTTLATNLAACAHLTGQRTLVLDCDKQGSAFDWYSAREDGSRLAGLAVVRADRALSLPKFREMSSGYDVVLVDGPPRLGEVTRAAAVAADVVLIPARPGAFDTWAASETLELLDGADEIREQLGRPPVRRVIVLNGAPPRARTVDFALDALRDAAELATVVIGNRVVYAATAWCTRRLQHRGSRSLPRPLTRPRRRRSASSGPFSPHPPSGRRKLWPMSTKAGRPVRPSVARESAARAAAKLERGAPSRLVIETSREVLKGVRLRAAQKGITVRAYVLELLAADGVDAARADLDARGKDER